MTAQPFKIGVCGALTSLLARPLIGAADAVISAIDHAEEVWDEPVDSAVGRASIN